MKFKEIITLHRPVSNETMESLSGCAQFHTAECGETLVYQGQLCDKFILNANGIFRVWMKENNTEHTVAFGTTGDIFTSLHSFYAHEPSAFSLTALEQTECWLISYEDMNRLMETHPELVRWMLDLALGQIFCLEKRYVNFSSSSASVRYRRFVGYFNKVTRLIKEPWFAQRIPLKYIAQYLGIAQSSLSRIRRDLMQQD